MTLGFIAAAFLDIHGSRAGSFLLLTDADCPVYIGCREAVVSGGVAECHKNWVCREWQARSVTLPTRTKVLWEVRGVVTDITDSVDFPPGVRGVVDHATHNLKPQNHNNSDYRRYYDRVILCSPVDYVHRLPAAEATTLYHVHNKPLYKLYTLPIPMTCACARAYVECFDA